MSPGRERLAGVRPATGSAPGSDSGIDRALSREDEFARLLRAYGPSLSRLAAAWTRSRSERDDLTQEIAVAIWRALPGFRNECSERTYVLRVAQNQAITYAGKRRVVLGPINEVEEETASGEPDPELAYAGAQRRDRLLAAIRQLPDSLRQVVTLALEDLSTAQIAQVIGITENNVAVRLSRAREALRRALGGET